MEISTFSTAEVILSQVRAKTRIGSKPASTALQNTAMLQQLHDVNEWAHNYPYTVGMLGWKFNDREAIVQGKASTTLNGAVLSGATSIILASGTNFDDPASTNVSAGYIKTGTSIYDYFCYETKSIDTLSNASLLDLDHASGEAVHKIYALPEDFGKTRSLFRQSNFVEYEYIDQDMRQVPPMGYYMLKSFTSTNNYARTFLVLPEAIGSVNFKLQYMKKADTISVIANKIGMPDGDGRQAVIQKMCEYVWDILGEGQMAATAQAKSEYHMDKCLSKWAMHTAQTNQSLVFQW